MSENYITQPQILFIFSVLFHVNVLFFGVLTIFTLGRFGYCVLG